MIIIIFSIKPNTSQLLYRFLSKTIPVNRLQFWLLFIIVLGFSQICVTISIYRKPHYRYFISALKQLYLSIERDGIKEHQRSIDQNCNGIRIYHSHPSIDSSTMTKLFKYENSPLSESVQRIYFRHEPRTVQTRKKLWNKVPNSSRRKSFMFMGKQKTKKIELFFYWIYLEDDWVLGIVYYFIWMGNMKWNRNENGNCWLDTHTKKNKFWNSLLPSFRLKYFGSFIWSVTSQALFSFALRFCVSAINEWEFSSLQRNEMNKPTNETSQRKRQKRDLFRNLVNCSMP